MDFYRLEFSELRRLWFLTLDGRVRLERGHSPRSLLFFGTGDKEDGKDNLQ